MVRAVPGRARDCALGHVLYRPPGETHVQRFGPAGARSLSLEVAAPCGSAVGERVRRLKQPVHLNDVVLRRLVVRLRRELAEPDEVSALAVEGLSLELLAELVRAVGRRDPAAPHGGADGRGIAAPSWVQHAEEYVRMHYADRLTLAQVAAAAGVSPTRLAQGFRSHLGTSVAGHVRQLRIEAACELLSDAELTLSRVAARLGFCDQSHFNRAFRRATGTTPLAFRRRMR